MWFFSKTTGTNTGEFAFGDKKLPPTGNPIQNGVQAASVIWTPELKIKYAPAASFRDCSALLTPPSVARRRSPRPHTGTSPAGTFRQDTVLIASTRTRRTAP